jgi:hypothetical protein
VLKCCGHVVNVAVESVSWVVVVLMTSDGATHLSTLTDRLNTMKVRHLKSSA